MTLVDWWLDFLRSLLLSPAKLATARDTCNDLTRFISLARSFEDSKRKEIATGGAENC